jgi:hypothetical protein
VSGQKKIPKRRKVEHRYDKWASAINGSWYLFFFSNREKKVQGSKQTGIDKFGVPILEI